MRGINLGHGSGTPTHPITLGVSTRASEYMRTVEHRHGLETAAPEEVAWQPGFSRDDLRKCAERLMKSGHGSYLLGLLTADDK